MTTKNIAPIYDHDCDACRLLGTVFTLEHGWMDLYVCPNPNDVNNSGVVARYGDEGPEYTSTRLKWALEERPVSHPLRIAAAMALPLLED